MVLDPSIRYHYYQQTGQEARFFYIIPYTILGAVSEWLKEAVLKTVEPQGSVGSNPTCSVTKNTMCFSFGSLRSKLHTYIGVCGIRNVVLL